MADQTSSRPRDAPREPGLSAFSGGSTSTGAMADVRDAAAWARNNMPTIARSACALVDPYRIVVVICSTGATLALFLAWTTLAAGIETPNAILAFYGP